MKAKAVKGNWNWLTKKFGLLSVFLLCIFFFLAGFYGFSFFNNYQEDEFSARARLLEKSTKEETEHRLLNTGQSGDNFVTSIPFQILSWNPRALYFPYFASAEQCESIIKMTRGGLKQSELALPKKSAKGIRTSYGVFISASEDKTGVLHAIEEKIAKATKIPRNHGEAFYILRYKVGQKYKSHYDAFGTAPYGSHESQRVATFLLYLTDVPEGGETMFPFENGSNMDGSYRNEDCIGLRIKPRKGDGLLFFSVFPNGTVDLTALHGGCPVIKGEKWVATKWIRNQIH